MNLAAAHTMSDTHERENEPRNVFFDYIHLPECKRLINRILSAQSDDGLKSIAVLSQFPGEGKTNFISMLALGYRVLLDKRVLIIDTVSHTRDESFYSRSGLENSGTDFRQGCVDLITVKNLSQRSALHYATEPSMHALSLWEERNGCESADFQVRSFVDSVKESYDLILMDTCALTEVNKDSFDPVILAQHADTTVIIASTPSLERETLLNLTTELKRHRIKPLGIVANLGIA